MMRGFTVIPIVILGIIIGIIVVTVSFSRQQQTISPEQTSTTVLSEQDAPKEASPTVSIKNSDQPGWSVYTNIEHGFQFKFPDKMDVAIQAVGSTAICTDQRLLCLRLGNALDKFEVAVYPDQKSAPTPLPADYRDTIGGKQARLANQPYSGQYDLIYYVEAGGKYFLIQQFGSYDKTDLRQAFNTIRESFKFLDL